MSDQQISELLKEVSLFRRDFVDSMNLLAVSLGAKPKSATTKPADFDRRPENPDLSEKR